MMRFKKSKFNQKELDFYHFCKKNFAEVLNSSITDIAKKFGCGISFIYAFFKSNDIKGSKDFIKLLTEDVYDDHLELNNFDLEVRNANNTFAQVAVATIAEIKTEYLHAINQEEKIIQICEYIINANYIYGLGFGYSKLAIADLFGFLNFCSTPLIDLNYDKNQYLVDVVKPDSVVIFYSIRFAQKKYFKILQDLKKIKNCKIILITSAPIENEKIDLIYQIENAVKFQESFGEKYLLSPLTSFCIFNTFIKSYIYEKSKETLMKNSLFIKESYSWYNK